MRPEGNADQATRSAAPKSWLWRSDGGTTSWLLATALVASVLLALAALHHRGLAATLLCRTPGWADDGQPRASTACQVNTSGSPFEAACTRLEDVCLDQSQFILYGRQYQQVGTRTAGALPSLTPDHVVTANFPWLVGDARMATEVEARLRMGEWPEWGRGRGSHRRRLHYVVVDAADPYKFRELPPLRARPASSAEPRRYLQAPPTFSTCTVPIIWTQNQDNLHHIIHDQAALLYTALNATTWWPHAKLVVATPEGLKMHPAEAFILQLLSRLSVQTLAEVSVRLPEGGQGPASMEQSAAGLPPAPISFEGGEQRCFKQLFVCHGATGTPASVFATGQFMLSRLHAMGRVPPATARCGTMCTAEQAGSAPVPLRVYFLQRPHASLGRQVLNIEELLRRCGDWTYRGTAGGPTFRLDCQQVAIESVEQGAAVAQEADVMVLLHGAALENRVFMRPGSAIVELTPFEMDRDRWGALAPQRSVEDATSEVLWFGVVVCDASLSKPGAMEALGIPDVLWDGKSNYPRHRSVRIPWVAISQTLRNVVRARGDYGLWRRRYWDTGAWRLYVTPNTTARGSCEAARAAQAAAAPPAAAAPQGQPQE